MTKFWMSADADLIMSDVAGQQPKRTSVTGNPIFERPDLSFVKLFDQVRAYQKAGPERTTDWSLEGLIPIVERRLPLITTANREQDIKDAIAFADRARVNIVIAGGAEANHVTALLKQKNIPVILGDRMTLPSREDDFHASSYQLAGELTKVGVKVAFSSGGSVRHPSKSLVK